MVKNGTFSRSLDEGIVEKLTKDSLWLKLGPDIRSGKVFPALRAKSVDFYHGGGRVFSYDGKRFKTHVKYASVMMRTGKADYVSETDLKGEDCRLITDFSEGYERIRENCGLYSGLEARGVSQVYSRHSCLRFTETVVMLDIEIALGGTEEDPGLNNDDLRSNRNRLDLLLFNTETKTLRFCEAKHFANPELWAPSDTPKVVQQLKRYGSAIEKNLQLLLGEYQHYVKVLNEQFLGDGSRRLPEPEQIETRPFLFVFGYDGSQRPGLKKHLVKIGELSECKFYKIGDTKNRKWKANTMWKDSCP
ncbi:MAG: hypothetical protein K8R59_04910 [Thermoanaerobaculales bacterium]|nr:hypothetical protein [Thermoanaerobaculales bacterium]